MKDMSEENMKDMGDENTPADPEIWISFKDGRTVTWDFEPWGKENEPALGIAHKYIHEDQVKAMIEEAINQNSSSPS